MKPYFCVWIDHTEAKILGVGIDSTDQAIVSNHGAADGTHRPTEHGRHGQVPMSHEFLQSIGEALLPARGIYIVGPGRAKTDLVTFLQEHFPVVSKKIWAIQPMDHPTSGELVAAARQFFKTATRVHG
ncbi:MAG: hypothetical protein EOP02_13250 [Proteobacteria bacterium]|nr:MAG: hypothetical protein EOP02_13250 [Pseudomonadota bacterium]